MEKSNEADARSQEILSRDYVNIGDASYLLPVASEYVFPFADDEPQLRRSRGPLRNGDTWHVDVKYKDHRHFEAATSILFEEAPAPPR